MRVRRGDLRDLYVEDGRSAVFVNEQVIVLSEIATVILESTPQDGLVTLEHLTAEVVGAVGAPAPPLDARDIVTRQVLDLMAHGILRSEEPITAAALNEGGVQSLRDALRYLLSNDTGVWTPGVGVDSDELLMASTRHRVTPTLAAQRERLALPSVAAARVSAIALQERATVDVLATELLRALDLLSAGGVRCLAFKGLALAAQAHGDATARGTGDLDLLVAPEDVEKAHRVVSSGGWTPTSDQPVPGPEWAWRHFMRTSYELTLVGRASTIDLHWHLTPARSAFPTFDTLWANSTSVQVLGRSVPTLSPYDALAHSASHSAKDGWGWLRGLVDVHRLMSAADTWTAADRPLTNDQLFSIGLAARMFGVPEGAPDVVRQALAMTPVVWDTVVSRQASGAATHEPTQIPGLSLVQGLRTLHWAGASGGDLWRRVSYSAMPPWLAVEETSPYATVAVPRVLAKRSVAFARRACASLG